MGVEPISQPTPQLYPIP